MTELTNRPATVGDAPVLVDFAGMASAGLTQFVWAGMADPGETPRDVGLRRAAGEAGHFNYQNSTVFERDGRPVAGLVGFPLPESPVEIGPDFPPAFVPFQELENLAPNHWYVNVLGVYPDQRGQGIGAAMLAEAEALGRKAGSDGMAIIVFSANPGALRLYLRTGYAEVARRRIAMPGWTHDGCEAILLTKSF
jgi:ribosomal protein S18 acetylase RimI-like enzyme